MSPAPDHDAQQDPWCVVALDTRESVLSGHGLHHMDIGGLAWLDHREMLDLDVTAGRATTRCGSRDGFHIGLAGPIADTGPGSLANDLPRFSRFTRSLAFLLSLHREIRECREPVRWCRKDTTSDFAALSKTKRSTSRTPCATQCVMHRTIALPI